MRGKHETGKYYHVRVLSPKKLHNMKTVAYGPFPRVRGINKHRKWVDQSLLIPRNKAKVSGQRLITNAHIKKELKKEGISSIRKMRTGGKLDYHIVRS